MKTYYLVCEKTLKTMLEDALKFHALETGGVDNWEGYGASFSEFLEEWASESKVEAEDYSFESLVKSNLKFFKKIMVESEEAE